ncbi:hypothetical protein CC80DRAFT_597513 [Byssothecium circinans]|uniref:F-box domain-containing protein n=1 Tax=Byssothecium circinans TaxID=147558 RepID=A0A6A5TIA6_9PLEO|nr:hypothetical protein CC80DRAFT_597513 [Byssothecium circinans]
MSIPTTLNSPSGPTWINALDGTGSIDTPYKTDFRFSAFGKLPVELRLSIFEKLPLYELAKVARVSRTARRNNPSYTVYKFHRTIMDRPDLAALIKNMKLAVTNRNMLLDIPTATFTPYQLPYPTRVFVKESFFAGALLSRALPNLETLWLVHLWGHWPRMPLVQQLTRPKYNWVSAGGQEMVRLRNLKELTFEGDEFLPTLTSLPSLEKLTIRGYFTRLTAHSSLQPSNTMRNLRINFQSWVLRRGSNASAQLSSLLACLPRLQSLKISIHDRRSSGAEYRYTLNLERWGDYSELIQATEPIRSTLKSLDIGLAYLRRNDTIGNDHFLKFCFRGHTFAHFASLTKLKVPYTALFALANPERGDEAQLSINEMLPSTLETLTIFWPCEDIFDRLQPIIEYPEAFPVLRRLVIHFEYRMYAQYVDIVFMYPPHPVHEALLKRGISVEFDCYLHQWDREIHLYDIKAMDMAAWSSSLGDPITGPVVQHPLKEPSSRKAPKTWVNRLIAYLGPCSSLCRKWEPDLYSGILVVTDGACFPKPLACWRRAKAEERIGLWTQLKDEMAISEVQSGEGGMDAEEKEGEGRLEEWYDKATEGADIRKSKGDRGKSKDSKGKKSWRAMRLHERWCKR